MEQQTQPQLNIDLKNTTSIETPEGSKVFQQGVLLRKVSKFVVGADEDAVMPIPVFYDAESGKILESTIPADLRDEYKEDSFNG
jgi:hypothetical protein|tara:strand:+ start:900 stop:1151 length:252 start_codon:yes stop_codon:yes gene_type:complete